MRRTYASASRVRLSRRFAAMLALVALLAQSLLPGTAAFAQAEDPLVGAPICTTGSHNAGSPSRPHKSGHAACHFCQAPVAAWAFLPPVPILVEGPHRLVRIVWRHETLEAGPAAVGGVRARGPPAGA